jgi:Protein of unknown function (DUF2855)
MPSVDSNLELLVRQDDPREFRIAGSPAPEASALDEGELLVRIEKFGLSANNVTYAVLGKSALIDYFDFFPTGEEQWGKVPVWGMAVITASRHPELKPGERMYGYFPLARYTRLRPARSTPLGFEVDRGGLPAAYNQYTVTRSDPFYVAGHEEAMIVFRPLVLTGILLDDFIAEGNDYFGARSIVIASASSKTSFGLAFMLARRHGDRAIIGLTSARNAAFVNGLGLYSQVLTYEDIGTLPQDVPTVFVDVAGDAGVRTALRTRLGPQLATTITVGLSHWDKAGGPLTTEASSGDPTIFFFAPGWLEQRRADWGSAVLGQKIVGAWHEFMGRASAWTRIVRAEGKDAVASVYADMVGGRCGPGDAHVLSL